MTHWNMRSEDALKLTDMYQGKTVKQMIAASITRVRQLITLGIRFNDEAMEYLESLERLDTHDAAEMRREFAIRRLGPPHSVAAETFDTGVENLLEREIDPKDFDSPEPVGKMAFDPLFPFE